MAGCSQAEQPTLACLINYLGPRPNATSPATQIERVLEATLSQPSENGVWKIDGNIRSSAAPDETSAVVGHYYAYQDGRFDLIASTAEERITVMPTNAILRERELQGVIMRGGETVSTGRPLTASCQALLPEEK